MGVVPILESAQAPAARKSRTEKTSVRPPAKASAEPRVLRGSRFVAFGPVPRLATSARVPPLASERSLRAASRSEAQERYRFRVQGQQAVGPGSGARPLA